MLKKFINWLYLIEDVPVKIKCVKLDDKAILPSKAHTGLFEDAAYDLFSTEDVLLQPNERKMIDTKLAFIIPDTYWIKLRERSGLANKGTHLLGGVIDCGYTGAVKVILYNSSKDPLLLPADKAICQFTVEKLTKSHIEELNFSTFSIEAAKRERGSKGFGSSDVKKTPNK